VLTASDSAMETQTLLTMGDNEYVRSQEVIVHELVHQWYGDLVTPTDWRDMWMNEGMTMYLQLVFRAEQTGQSIDGVMAPVRRYDQSLRKEAGPPGAYNPAMFGSSNVYYGPALMWNALRTGWATRSSGGWSRSGRSSTPTATRPATSGSTGSRSRAARS